MNPLTGTHLGLVIQEKALPPLKPLSSGGSGWWPVVREPYTGAWQRNDEVAASTALAYFAVYACVSLIAGDIAKLCLRLVQKDENGIWTETENSAYSPVLRKPNRYQTIQKFIEQWIVSKLIAGNTYALKQRDNRGVVTALYILAPLRVTPLVTTDGGVYYQIQRDDLNGLPQDSVTVPASEIIHDIMCALYHPLIGVTPIYAAGIAAAQGLAIQNNSTKFFGVGSAPSGILTAPGSISDETAARLKAYFETNFAGDNIGKVAVAGDGLKYEQLTMKAIDAQLIEQLKWTADTVCSCFHVPPYMIGVGPPPPYANVEPLVKQYYAQCLQSLITALESTLDEGLALGPQFGNRYGTEFDPDDLIWLDTQTKSAAARDGVGGAMSPNEARKKYYGLGPVKGGEVPILQQQYWPIDQLAERQTPGIPAAPTVTPPNDEPPDDAADTEDMTASFSAALFRKASEELYAA